MEILTTLIGIALGYVVARYQIYLSDIKEHNQQVDYILYRLERTENNILYPEGSQALAEEWYDIMLYCEVYFNYARENFYEYDYMDSCRVEFIDSIRALKK